MENRKKKRSAVPCESDFDNSIAAFIAATSTKSWFLCICLFAILIRLAVALHPYSGAQTPPMFGDYEAQRHWMEITVNLPVKEWYRNSTENDLGYWGLDYPPLTAYQSYLHGLMLKFFDPASVALFTSRGFESYTGGSMGIKSFDHSLKDHRRVPETLPPLLNVKLLMRWTVLISDLMIFFPAVLFFVTVHNSVMPTGDKSCMAWHTVMVLLNPCLILIDHGHFQYNCISLGLTMAAVAAILSNRHLFGSMLFCLALNHKQMSAYYAPAFFAYLLGKCLRHQNPILELLKLGLVVLGTFAMVWWPYLHSMDASLEVLSRLAPFERGIYEDYVANLWCTTSVIVKWKRLFTTPSLKLLSLAATVSSCLPSMIQLLWSPSRRGFLYGLVNSSLAFYLVSFQVHEKSILLPLLPASLLSLEEPLTFQWLTYTALLSMFPLLNRDKLLLPYAALCGLFTLLYYSRGGGGRADERGTGSFYSLLKYFAFVCSLFLHIIYLTVNPPDKYPFLFEALIMMFCFSQFLFISIYLNRKQWLLSKISIHVDSTKKSL